MANTNHATFVIERTYAAPRERVFAAWSEAKSKRAWFAEGEGWQVKSYELDFRERGGERASFYSDTMKSIFSNETTFDDIVENERIVFTYAMSRDGARFSISLTTVEFKDAGAGTRLLFTEHATFFEGADGVQMREQGWTQLLGRLAAHLGE